MQSRIMSLVEVTSSVIVGYGVAVCAQIVVFPWFGLTVALHENLAIAAVFTVVSIIRSYVFRRLFERIRRRNALRRLAAADSEML